MADFNNEIDGKKFLWIARPAKYFFCEGCSLKAAVITSLIFDYLIGFLELLRFAIHLFDTDKINSMPSEFQLEFYTRHIFNLSSFLFFYLGTRGIMNRNPDYLQLYAMFKVFEMFFSVFLSITLNITICSEFNVRMEIICNPLWFMFIYGIQLAWDFVFTYMVWSAAKRLAANQVSLVLYGIEIVEGARAAEMAVTPEVYEYASPPVMGAVSIDED